MRLELTRPFGHYPLKVACIPISPPAHWLYAASKLAMEKLLPHDAAFSYVVPETGLEPAHLAACAPETHASTNSAIWARVRQQGRKGQYHSAKLTGRLVPPLFPQIKICGNPN